MKVHNLLVTGSHTSSGEDIRLISSSVATINNAQNDRLNSIESITGSLVSKTGSFATTGSNVFIGTQTISGSLIPAVDNTYDLGSVTHQFRDLYLSSASLYIDGTKVLSSTTQELQITTDAGQSFKILEAGSDTITLQSNDGNITLATSGGGDVIMDPTNGIIALKGTTTIYAGNRILSSDGNNIHFGNGVVISGSLLATGTNLISGSSQILNGSGIISSSAQLPSGIVSSSSQVTGYGFSTTGSNTFQGTQVVTGSLFISENLIVAGSSSIQHISSSVVNIADNIITVNALNPSVRFGGLAVIDSGSNPQVSGSMLFDSVNNQWLFVHQNQDSVTSSVLLMGPETYNDLGNESYITANRLVKSTGIEHLTDSNISDTGTKVSINSNTEITGTFVATGTALVSGSAQITYGSISNIPSGIVSGSAQILSGTGILSGSAQLPNGTVSGSIQIDVLSTTNIARLATTGSNTFSSNQTITNGGRPYFIANTTNSGEEAGIKIQQGTVSDWYIGTAQGTTSAQDIAIRDVKNSRIPFFLSSANGSSTFSSIDGSGARTTPFNVMTLIADNSSNPYDGFGAELLFKNRIYSGGPTPGGIQNGARIRTSLKNNSTVNLGTDLVFDVTTTGNGALTTALTLSYDNGATFSGNAIFNGNIGVGVSPLTKLHLQGASPNYILLTNTAADGVQNAIQGGIIGQSRGYSNNLSQMASILFRNENSAAWYKGEITFNTNGSDGTNPAVSPTERLRITSSGNIGINDVAPSRKLTVNFGTSVNDGLIVYGSQRLNTVFQSTGEHCFIYMDSHHANTFLPKLHFQRSSTTYGTIGLERASNSDPVGSYEESEMIVGSTASVSFSLQTNGARRIKIAGGGGVTVYNNLSVNGNLTARNFSRSIKTFVPAGATGSGTSTSYNWADELAALAGNFDSGGYYKGFLRSGNGAHYYGYHFDILVGSIGYGSNSLQYKVQNIVSANAPWAGGCGFNPFGTVDTTGFVHNNNPCGEVLELSITRLGV